MAKEQSLARFGARHGLLLKILACAAVLAAALFIADGCAQQVAAPDEDAGASEVGNHVVDFEGISNARDLGGYTVADGRTIKSQRLVRCGNLDNATDVDLDTIKNDLHASVICDLRTVGERSKEDPAIDGVDDEWLDVDENIRNGIYGFESSLDTDDGLSDDNISTPYLRMVRAGATDDGGIYDQDMYLRLLEDDQAKNAFRQLFRELLSAPDDTAVIWHGDAGTHRTGVASMLVLAALGADEDMILQDYAYSNDEQEANLDALRQAAEQQGASSSEVSEIMKIAGATPDYLNHTMSVLDERYGSIEGYLTQELGLNDTDLQLLRDKYLE